MITIRYFASLRDEFNIDSEALDWNKKLSTVAAIKESLSIRDAKWQNTLNNKSVLSAVNQKMADNNASITDGDEIAFFPPVTGG
ncbi:MAG: molybdopterin synthase sulfur carrier subunit [Cellvibrionaceae bacterium]|jgi:molybdopterin synthase sulfur carrier subunit